MDSGPEVSALALTNGTDETDCPPLPRITTESVSTMLSTFHFSIPIILNSVLPVLAKLSVFHDEIL
jgi:hypothetical protein